ncbi:periplasmic substrate-binding component of an ABC superfamily nickel transporter [Citrobacter freundii ATCC 8090 = MTCC 1658 = NBRC 12681]|uniref:ABC transporter substrate-binding protein n=1 Tax=Citrobacter freundii TaxID=546 RepID=UPI000299B981|nr:ABC transporter substrate-binding protein [Citrobacter freundii]EKS55212.1 nickel ABC transporter periplasmic nickel-binding protein [Citrobacter freundii ATCC 8090 = MTCC 1658 = NBRC 12681]EXF28210.1 nickel ABC transporter substrate-binding protein [Citrobacter freundii RLS1]KFB98333.1 periplasmic substrate-binding component of an ABC superfamily nickel transporter [Citrobacter freundii ATCC 8090 = MTCC 1658 = NBRC 12681]QIH68780.1 ABC transporter substrate-binding protein [Citrobacter freu
MQHKNNVNLDNIMIKGKLALLTCALTLALTSPLLAAQNASEGQTLKLAIGPEPTEGFDPMLGWSHGSYLLLHAPLLKQNADMSWGNLLTEKVETSSDGKTWTLTLKPDLKFSDGSPLTAEDVVFTYNKAAKSGGKIDMGNFTHASLKDNRTVEITLRSPQSTFVNVLGSLGIVPQKRYDEKTFAKNPIGAGPYRLVSFQPGQQLIVEANPWYAGKKNDFSKLVFVFLDEDNAYAAARSGQLGLVRIAPSMAVAPQQKNLKLWVRDSVENRGIVFPMVPAGKKDANGYPIGNDITADVAIRRAINYAIDRKQLADQVMEGHAIPAYSAVQGLPWQGQSVAFKDGDSEKARTILEEAGWKVGKDGVRVKDGKEARLTLWYASGDSTRRDLAEAVRAMLEPVGIQISLQSGSWETVERHMHANPTLFGWGSLDPMELFHHYSNQAAGVEYYNPGYYSNPVVEQHLKQAIDAPDWQKALPFWQQVEWDGKQGAGVQGDAAWAWLLNIQHTYLANPCIDLGKGAPEIHGSWSLLNNLDEWTWTCR